MTEGELTDKQRVFVEEYLKSWNASEAARRAGYSEDSAGFIGWENLKKPVIAEAIKARLAEKAMAANEVLARLADQARGTMEDFLYIGPKGKVKLDLSKAARSGKLHLLHKYSKGKGGIINIELYDAQHALEQLAKLFGMYPAEKLEIDVKDLDNAIERELAKLVASAKTTIPETTPGKESG